MSSQWRVAMTGRNKPKRKRRFYENYARAMNVILRARLGMPMPRLSESSRLELGGVLIAPRNRRSVVESRLDITAMSATGQVDARR